MNFIFSRRCHLFPSVFKYSAHDLLANANCSLLMTKKTFSSFEGMHNSRRIFSIGNVHLFASALPHRVKKKNICGNTSQCGKIATNYGSVAQTSFLMEVKRLILWIARFSQNTTQVSNELRLTAGYRLKNTIKTLFRLDYNGLFSFQLLSHCVHVAIFPSIDVRCAYMLCD